MKKELERQRLDASMEFENAISFAEQEKENLSSMNEDALLSLEAIQKSEDEQDLLSQKYDRVFYQSGSKRKKR